jgi:hypothetical protein
MSQITILDNGRFSLMGLPPGSINPCSEPKNIGGHPKIGRIQYERRIDRAAELNAGFLSIDPNEFSATSTLLIERLRDCGYAALLTRGVYPTAIPTLDGRRGYATTFFRTFIPSLRDSMWRRSGLLTNNFSEDANISTQEQFTCTTRHWKMLKKAFRRPVYGLYLPFALQGFSIEAARRLINELPDNFSLCGPVDICATLLLYEDFFIVNSSRPTMVAAGTSSLSDQELSVAIGTITHEQNGGKDNQIELHCGFSPPYLYTKGLSDFSPGLLFTL